MRRRRSTTVTDTIDVTTATLTATPSVAEGGTITYTVSLGAPVTGSDVSVLLANGQTVTIPVGAASASVTATAPDNVYGGGASVANNIASVSGGNFEQLTPNTAPVTTTVTDDADVTTVALSATPSVAEGGSIVYTATLSSAAQTPVTVTLSNSATITIAAGATTGTVTVAAPGDDPYVDASTVSATISTATGGNFESLQINPAAANTSVTDTIDATTVSLSATASVAEGGSIVYTATLSNAAQTAVTVTLSTGETITVAAGATSGSVSIAAPSDDVYVDAGSVSRTITAASGGNFESLTVNTTPATTTVTDTLDTTTVSITGDASVAEGATAAYTVSLTSPAQTAVTINLSYSGVAIDGTDFTGVASVTIPAGASSAAFNIATLQDVLAEGAESFTVTIASAAGGNFENLVISASNGAATTSITDDDTPTLAVSSPTVGEGGFAVFTVSLSNPSTTDVSFNPTLASGSATVGTDTSTALEYFDGSAWLAVPVGGVTIAAGQTSVQVRVATVDDFAAEPDETFALTATVSAGLTANASATGTATIIDDVDATTVSLTATPSVAEGGSIVYTATLSNAAATAMTVTLSNGAVISIAAGAASGTVSVSAPSDDPYIDAGSVAATIASTSGGGLEALSIDATAAATTVTDTIDVTTATLTATPSVVEGGTIVYTATLTNAAQTPVTVTLSSGQTITIATGATTGTVSIAAPGDDPYLDASTVSRTIVSAAGGNFESLVVDATAATTSVTDTIDTTTATLTATPSVIEGGTITYTVSLTAPVTGSPVTVALSGGQTITIPVGASSGTATSVAPDNVYLGGGSVPNSIASVSGGNYENLSANTATVTTTVTDDVDVTSVSLSATPSVAEGGSIVYTATLSNAAQTPVTVTLSSGQTITIAAGATTGTVSIAAPGDDPYLDAGTVSRTIASANGGNFESLQVNPTAASTSVTDTIDTTTVSLSATPSVAEGGSIVYTATLSNAAQTPVTVTLSTGQTIAIAAGATTGTVSIAAPGDDPHIDAGSVSRTIASASGGNFESLVVNPTAAVTTVTDTIDATTVSLSATPSVAEGGSIVYTATLTNTAQTPVTVTLSSGQTITIAAGATVGTVSIAAPGDDPYIDASIVSRTIATASGGNFESLIINPAAASTSVTDTIDTTTLSITGSASVAEGTSGTYTVSLTSPAQTAVTVNLSYAGTATNGTDYTGVATVTIAAGASSATFNIATIDDLIHEVAAESFTVSVSTATGGNFENLVVSAANGSVTTTIVDNDAAPTISVSSPTVGEAGGFAVFTIGLSAPSSVATTVNLSLVNGSATGGGTDYGSATATNLQVSTNGGTTWTNATSATFAAGATSVLVRTPIIDDALNEANETFSLTATRSAGSTSNPSATGTATIIDNDAIPALSINNVSVNENAGTMTFTVTLSAASGQNVSVNYGTSNGTATAGADYTATGGTLNFAAGVTSQTVTVNIADDTIFEGNETFNVNLSGATNATIATATGVGTIIDNDAAPTVSSVSAASVTEGGNLVHTVTLSNPSSTATTFAYSLAGTTATAGADFSTAATFSNGVTLSGGTLSVPAGVTSFTVTYATVDDALNEPAETTTLSVGGVAAVGTIVDNDPVPTLSINNVSVNEAAGTATFTVTLSAASGQAVTVNYGTSNGTATAGSDYTATSGALSFASGVTSRTITVAITDDALTESSETFNVNLSGAVNATIATATGVGTIVDNDTPPLGRDATVTTPEDVPFVFALANFLMNDAEQGNNVLPSAVRIDTLPANGSLFLNGVLVTVGQVISAAAISAGQLTFASAQDANGANYANFNFSVRDASGLYDTGAERDHRQRHRCQ